MNGRKINVMIADDHPMVIDGLLKMLGSYSDLHCCEGFITGSSLLDALEKEQPDVLLLDMQLSDYIGEDLVPILLKQYPSIRILIVSSIDTDTRIKNMMRIGCAGYVLKNIAGDDLAKAIRAVQQGNTFLSEDLKSNFLESIFQTPSTQKRPGTLLLTRREKEILQLVAKEYSTKEIASLLCISPFTVENHRKNLFAKLDVKNVAGLVRKGLILGLIS